MEKEKIKKENEIVKDRLGLSLELTFVVLAIFILGFQTGIGCAERYSHNSQLG